MVSAIDATKPVDGQEASKLDLRNNLLAAKAEIEALQVDVGILDFSGINVQSPEYGATGDGVIDDTVALTAAFNDGIAQGKPVMIPPGEYRVQSQESGKNVFDLTLGKDQSLVVFCPIRRGAKLVHYAFNGGNPDTNWELIGGAVWRGSVFRFSGPSLGSPDHAEVVVLKNLDIDGNFAVANQQSLTFPANPTTGDGWDITNHGVVFDAFQLRKIYMEDCAVHDFRGEPIHSSGAVADLFFETKNCLIENSNAGAINMGTAAHRFHDGTRIINCYNDAFEDAVYGSGVYRNLYIENCGGMLVGHILNTEAVNDGFVEITGCELKNCRRWGITYQGYNGIIHDNKILDCGYANSAALGSINVVAGVPGIWTRALRNISVYDNHIFCKDQSPNSALRILTGDGADLTNVHFRNNVIGKYPGSAENNGPFLVTARNTLWSNVSVTDNVADGLSSIVFDNSANLTSFENVPKFAGNTLSNIENVEVREKMSVSTGDVDIRLLSPRVQILPGAANLEPNIIGVYSEGAECLLENVGVVAIILPSDSGQWGLEAPRTLNPGDALQIKYLRSKWREVMYLPA